MRGIVTILYHEGAMSNIEAGFFICKI